MANICETCLYIVLTEGQCQYEVEKKDQKKSKNKRPQ